MSATRKEIRHGRNKEQKIALIVGAGPAGLTAAYELLARTDIKPIVLEAEDQVGGISRTVNYNGNRIDIGGHRFFSKSDRIMDWWTKILPIQSDAAAALTIAYQGQQRSVDTGTTDAAATSDEVMLVRNRVSRILHGRKFFDYPIKPNLKTLGNLGVVRSTGILLSYIKARLFPVRPEVSLRDFIVNRFGYQLYSAFFRDYTEKVWGVPCEQIPADWGAQRIKGLSVSKLILHSLRRLKPGNASVRQKDVETSLIERFLYPKFGPGQLWEKVARLVEEAGSEVHLNTKVVGVRHENGRAVSATIQSADGNTREIEVDYIFSSMPVKELAKSLSPAPPADVRDVAGGLKYRDFLTVGVLVKRLKLNGGVTAGELCEKTPDNWIYVQEPDVKVGRLQLFNNWSPYLVADAETIWIGMEYFLDEKDGFWALADEEIGRFAIGELDDLGMIDASDVLDHVVVRTKKAYPAYFGSYNRFDVVREYLQSFENLFCIGRNGMHRYNNQDHSMLTAMVVVDGLSEGIDVRELIWQINTEQEHHEVN